MAEDQAQRTEPATPKKREDARRKGQVAQSRDLQSVTVLGASALVLAGSGAGIVIAIQAALQFGFTAAERPPESLAGFHAAMLGAGLPVAAALLPFLMVVPAVAALVQVAQVGPMFSPEALKFRGDRIDLIKGLGRMVKADRWVELLKTMAKLGLISFAAWLAFRPELPRVMGLSVAALGESVQALGWVAAKVVAAALAVLATIALFDAFFQRHRHEGQLKMSKREVRDELRQSEGDSTQRSRFRARQRELSRSRMIAAVAEADVVVTNPTHFAVALRYDRANAGAPEVVAKGRDRVAARIREAAEQAGVPVVEDKPLARILHRTCKLGHEIPANLFQAVAELFALVHRLNERQRRFA